MARATEIEAQVKEHQQRAIALLEEKRERESRRELEQATALAIQAYGVEMRAWLTRKVKDSSQADDLFQEVCTGLWRGLLYFRWGTPEQPCSLRTWFYKIAFYAICHQQRSTPQHPSWARFLREAQLLPKENPLSKKIAMQAKALHRRAIRAYEFSEDPEQEASELEAELLKLSALLPNESFKRFGDWLRENASLLGQSILMPQPQNNIAQSELSQIAEEISSMGQRIDKQNQLLECLQQLKEQDRLIILLRQLEGGIDSWKDIARALHGYRTIPEEELDTEASRLRQRFHRSMEELKVIAKTRGLTL